MSDRQREKWTQGHRAEVKTIRGFAVLIIGCVLLYFGSGALVTGMGAGIATVGLIEGVFPKAKDWLLPIISRLVRRLKLPFLSEPLQVEPEDSGEV